VASAAFDVTVVPHDLPKDVLAAQQNDVEYLWLDAWAYRKQPPWANYQHGDFVRTLLAVMLCVSHVIWLPRSRSNARGEYQYRIWCTFEAAIVHLRRLPVTMAGHRLNRVQCQLVSEGSYLINYPWTGGWLHASDMDNLGKTNGAFLMIALPLALVNLIYAVVRTWKATSFKTWWNQVISRGLLLLFQVLIWIFTTNVVLGQAVMFSQNGRRVLRLLTTAAADTVRPIVDVGDISRTMPWLPAYDRRDTMTIKMVLDSIERVLEAEAEAGAEAERSIPAAATLEPKRVQELGAIEKARHQLKQLTDRTVRGSIEPWRRTHATALCIFAHARLLKSPGDDPQNYSLRAWLAAIGVELHEASQASLLDEKQRQALPICRERRWLDTKLTIASAEVQASPAAKAEEAAGEVAAADPDNIELSPNVSPDESSLVGTDLQQYGWWIVRGVDDFVQMPVGRFALVKSARKGTRVIDLALANKIEAPDLRLFACCLFYLFAVLNTTETIKFVIQDTEARNRVFAANNPFWIDGFSSDIPVTIQQGTFAVMLAILFGLKLRCDVANWRFPIPLRGTGKLEYALLWTLLGSSVATSALSNLSWEQQSLETTTQVLTTVRTSTSASPIVVSSTVPIFSVMGVQYVCTILYVLAFLLVAAYETATALTHAVVACIRYQSLRHLLELTELIAESKSKVV